MYEYQLISACSPGQLSAAVCLFLGEGWELWGNPFASGPHEYDRMYCQAVVKFDPLALRASPPRGGEAEAGYRVNMAEGPAPILGDAPKAEDFRELGRVMGSVPVLRIVPYEEFMRCTADPTPLSATPTSPQMGGEADGETGSVGRHTLTIAPEQAE